MSEGKSMARIYNYRPAPSSNKANRPASEAKADAPAAAPEPSETGKKDSKPPKANEGK